MITKVLLPQLELTMESVTVVSILVNEGAHVAAEQSLIEVETQKSISEVPAPVAGYLRGLAVKAGDTISEKALICYIASTADEPFVAEAPEAASAVSTARAGNAPTVTEAPSAEPAGAGLLIKAVPAARRVARERNVDLAKVKPTGAGGMITLRDVETHAVGQEAAAGRSTSSGRDGSGSDPGWTEIASSRLALNAQMQKSLAEIPQFVVTRRMKVTPLSGREDGATFTQKLIAKLGEALQLHSALRTMTDGRRIKVLPVSVAVAIDTPAGLIAPVLRACDLGSVSAIASRLTDFRERAARRAISTEELKDGPFAVSNLGMLGVDFFTPFFFHGQAAVLAVGKSTDDGAGGKAAWFSLAVDHRVVDGAEAARFLETLQQRISA